MIVVTLAALSIVLEPRRANATPAANVRGAVTAAAVNGADDDGPNPDSLARLVILGGESGRAALREAIRASGIGVRVPGDSVGIEPAQPAQGIWFDGLELAAMERGEARGTMVTLGDIARVLRRGEPGVSYAPFAAAVLADLREDTRSDVPTRRFFARFLIALGGWRDTGLNTPPDSTRLDAVQLAFVTRRLHADLVLAMPGGIDGLRQTGLRSPAQDQNAVSLSVHARPVSGPYVADDRDMPARAFTASRCTLTDNEQTALDYTAVAFGTGFGQVAGAIGGKLAAYASAAGVASMLASYAKLALMFTFLEATWENPDGNPLVRTRSTTINGAQATITVRLTYKIDDLQLVNCVRLAFNAVGFDFSMPNGGAVSGAEVNFSTMEGMPTANYDAWWHSEGFDPGYVEMVGKPLNVATDEGGRAKVMVQGIKQRETIPKSAEPFERPASVQARVRLTQNDLVKDMAGVAGGAMSGGLATLASMIPELVTRAAIPFDSHKFTVRDWAFGYHVKAQQQGILLGDPGCLGIAENGTDLIEGFLPVKNGHFKESKDFVRWTSAPICSAKPVLGWVTINGKRKQQWEGIACTGRLNGHQRLKVNLTDSNPGEPGGGIRIEFDRVPGAAHADVTGDCLRSRYGTGYPHDFEFAGRSREDWRRSYMGLPGDHGEKPYGDLDWAGGSFFIPSSAMVGKDHFTFVVDEWHIEIKMVGLD